MFQECSNLKSIDLSNWGNTLVSGDYDMANLFSGCTLLESVNMSNFNAPSVTKLFNCFTNCSNLKEVDLGSFDTSNITGIGELFKYCSKLEKINFSSADFTNITSWNGDFIGVPTSAEIIVKDETQANWLLERFPDLTNVIYS